MEFLISSLKILNKFFRIIESINNLNLSNDFPEIYYVFGNHRLIDHKGSFIRRFTIDLLGGRLFLSKHYKKLYKI